MNAPSSVPPVAFRLRRPYANEDEFVDGDGPFIDRSGMLLVGAIERPAGLVIRFEVSLADGTPLLRGEGRVHRPSIPHEGARPPGLDVQFLKLDPKGRALVERVLRERGAARRSEAAHPDEHAPAPREAASSGPWAIPSLGPPSSPRPSGPYEDDAPTVAIPPAAPLPDVPTLEPPAAVPASSDADAPPTTSLAEAEPTIAIAVEPSSLAASQAPQARVAAHPADLIARLRARSTYASHDETSRAALDPHDRAARLDRLRSRLSRG